MLKFLRYLSDFEYLDLNFARNFIRDKMRSNKFQSLKSLSIVLLYCLIIDCAIVAVALYMMVQEKSYEMQLSLAILELSFPM